MFFVAEIFSDRQGRQRDAQARPGRLGHLPIDKCALGFLPVVRIDNAGFLEFQPQVIAFARTFADAREYRNAAVFGREVFEISS